MRINPFVRHVSVIGILALELCSAPVWAQDVTRQVLSLQQASLQTIQQKLQQLETEKPFIDFDEADFNGGDIQGKVGFTVRDFVACKEQCLQLSSCIALSFNSAERLCYLKDRLNQAKPEARPGSKAALKAKEGYLRSTKDLEELRNSLGNLQTQLTQQKQSETLVLAAPVYRANLDFASGPAGTRYLVSLAGGAWDAAAKSPSLPSASDIQFVGQRTCEDYGFQTFVSLEFKRPYTPYCTFAVPRANVANGWTSTGGTHCFEITNLQCHGRK